jgi:hypothetical protein
MNVPYSFYMAALGIGRQGAIVAGTAARQSEERERVRGVLAKLKPEHAGLILLRAEGFAYDEIGAVLNLKTTSVGTLLARPSIPLAQEVGTYFEAVGVVQATRLLRRFPEVLQVC